MDTLLIAVHIPKTGGTTFKDILKKTYRQKLLYLDKVHNEYTPSIHHAISDICINHGEAALHGHFYLPHFYEHFPSAKLATWLRDPVQRVVSHCLYNARSAGETWALTGEVNEDAILSFAQQDKNRNVMTTYLGGRDIDEFDFVGITEHFEESLSLFCRIFHKPEVKIHKHKALRSIMARLQPRKLHVRQRNRLRNDVSEMYCISPTLKQTIIQLNDKDIALYKKGIIRFSALSTPHNL